MEQKLQELLDKIYNEGVAKGQDVAATMVRDAERKAERIVEEAKKEAEEIRNRANEEAEELRRNVSSELRLSAEQALHALRQQVSHLIITKAVNEPLRDAFSGREFLKKIIETLIRNWDPGNEARGLALLLPEKEREELGQYFSAKAREILNGSLEIRFDDKLESGFRIGPEDGSYLISFTEKDFQAFFSDYLRPKTKALLYGSN
ncbi:MAG: hypothetical protein KDD06_20405 [Phaeodactylibacter sp.]|nr:hypothetical protein [Phaeodactylibacter sp.]MCB9266674.1 V-type ATP synthase subunit E [Lewinellaceae bacterium]MCB9289207.1 V-type ATP synthase subunit E [Lewinellaceae bacterium]